MARNKFDVDERLETPFQWKHLKRAGAYIGRHKFQMIAALLLSALASVASLFIPKLTQWVLDDAVPNKDTAMIGRMAAMFVGIILISIVFTTIRSRIMAYVSQEIIYDIRRDLFAHLQQLPFSYYDSRPAGKILVRVINYVNSVSDILSNGIINMILEIINLIFIVIFMFSTDVKLALIILAGLPFFVAIVLMLKPRQRKAWQEQSNKNSNYNAYLAESIDGVRVSQLFDRQEVNIGIMRKLAEACRRAWIKAIYISNAVWLSSESLTQIVLTFLYIAGVYWIGGGSMVSFGVILAMSQYVGRFWQPITNLANIYNSFINNIAYLERIFETMDEPVVVDDAPNAETLPDISGEVEFRDVTFRYPDAEGSMLRHVSFTAHRGETVALIGSTGSGKSTVINLIPRFYDATWGQVLVDGVDVRDYSVRALRNKIGYVSQKATLFGGTVSTNVAYGDNGRGPLSEADVAGAIDTAQAAEFVEKMEGAYHAQVAQGGANLSGGQRQRLSIARAIARKPEILIFDDSFSALDYKTDRVLRDALARECAETTRIIVAQRIGTIRDADRIIVLEDGRVVGQGTHAELMTQGGLYRRFIEIREQAEGWRLA